MTNRLTETSQGAKYSLNYITVGALVMIWSTIWYYYLRQNAPPEGDSRYYVCAGLFLSGLAVMIIGLLVGRIGKEGKNADVPIENSVAPVAAPTAQPINGSLAQEAAAPVAQPVQSPNQLTSPRV